MTKRSKQPALQGDVIPPDQDAVAIGELYRSACASYIDSAKCLLEAGHRLIAKKKSKTIKHGEWLPWLEAHAEELGFSRFAASRLMTAATKFRAGEKIDEAKALEINREIWGHKSASDVPEKQFERQVESEKPPTVQALAAQGTKRTTPVSSPAAPLPPQEPPAPPPAAPPPAPPQELPPPPAPPIVTPTPDALAIELPASEAPGEAGGDDATTAEVEPQANGELTAELTAERAGGNPVSIPSGDVEVLPPPGCAWKDLVGTSLDHFGEIQALAKLSPDEQRALAARAKAGEIVSLLPLAERSLENRICAAIEELIYVCHCTTNLEKHLRNYTPPKEEFNEAVELLLKLRRSKFMKTVWFAAARKAAATAGGAAAGRPGS
jgi:hypothetical protein